MSFEEKPFLILFAITYVLWWIVRRRERMAVGLLLSASLVFYGFKNWQLLPILLIYCVLDWAVARKIERGSRPRFWMTIGVAFNIAVLCLYKYTPLVVTSFQPERAEEFRDWSIPFGISFYAFTGVAYIVDVYRKVHNAEASLIRYTLSAVFFPHLVAGPILRPHEFLDYVRPGQLPKEPLAVTEATWLIARGFFKKLVVANRLGEAIDPFFAHVNDPTTAGAWALPYVYLYALQIYFDFSAYTDLARGIGLLFGYRWPENFSLPYLATNIGEFWRRWHMTLSRFLRDYIYIPLGGNRHGPIRTQANLMLTMLLGGLWHGASWSFVIWGGLHGTYLILHKMWSSTPIASWLNGASGILRAVWLLVAGLLTFHAVCLAWCFFRLTVFTESIECVRKCVEFETSKMWSGTYRDPSVLLALGSYAAILLVAWSGKPRGQATAFHTGFAWGLRFATIILVLVMAPPASKQPFIYFRF
ncbi:MAG: MBOAT family protein [Gemmataceae bacterium]|nr:MBOAT family protein [Gemmataceae bacterium]